MKRFLFVVTTIAAMVFPALAHADVTISSTLARNTVQVICADRQGSGALIHNDVHGVYILTVGHLPIDSESGIRTDVCKVGFVPDVNHAPTLVYRASVVHAIFDLKTDRDFAVLKLEEKVFGNDSIPATPFATNEFAKVGDSIDVLGFPSGNASLVQGSTGHILGYARGTLRSDAPISPGFSGGPVLDVNGNIVGVAARIDETIDPQTGAPVPIDFEMGDVLNLIGWLDDFGPAEHDKFLSHADSARFDGAPYVARDEQPGCAFLVRAKISPTVFCLLKDAYRFVFPNQATFASWFPKATNVLYIAEQNLAEYRLTGNVTMRAGSLVKIQTDPRVYVVADSFGTLRWIPTEERARAVFGDQWRSLVQDIPDVFFGDYHVGPPLL